MPRWEQLVLEERDLDAPGAVVASDGDSPADQVGRGCPDGRTWPSLRAALDALGAEGWRLVSVAAGSRRLVRYTLHRPRP